MVEWVCTSSATSWSPMCFSANEEIVSQVVRFVLPRADPRHHLTDLVAVHALIGYLSLRLPNCLENEAGLGPHRPENLTAGYVRLRVSTRDARTSSCHRPLPSATEGSGPTPPGSAMVKFPALPRIWSRSTDLELLQIPL
ncbi:hypothetical protein PAPYR_9340 [Paratrimastix pyriformis]|uniref:Uncharacterized protein n=1 Tax=Paratrimastix pyriformis TaxID=342808 RepID=A0ABQ8UCQ0_9EUKA|nr:hypothetical protein PAPYR_9340 [Paratrimastix pyriformis]